MRKQILVAAAAALLAAGTAAASEEVTHSFSTSFLTSAARAQIHRVVIDIPAGSVRIRNGAANRISVSGHVRRRFDGYRRRGKEQVIADNITAEIVVSGDEAIVRRHYGPGAQSWSAKSIRSVVEITVD